jgi:hypothetical protein
MPYTLYKAPIQTDTLWIVRYLHHLGKSAEPNCIIERNYPIWVAELPSIEDSNGNRYIGLDKCISYYESVFNVSRLQEKSIKFREEKPVYTIKK